MVRDIRNIREYETDKLHKVQDRLILKRAEADGLRASLVDQWGSLRRDEEDFRCAFIQFHEV